MKKVSLELGGNARSWFSRTPTWMRPCKAPSPASTQHRPNLRVREPLFGASPVYEAFAGNCGRQSLSFASETGWLASRTRVADRLQGRGEGGGAHRRRCGQGGESCRGRKRHALGGTFFEPTILTNVTPAMLVAREETFGPVAPLFKFDTEAQAIAMANDTEFGLAPMFTPAISRAAGGVSEAIEYGIVGLNTGLISTEVAPFAASKSRERDEKDRSTASSTTPKSSTCASAP